MTKVSRSLFVEEANYVCSSELSVLFMLWPVALVLCWLLCIWRDPSAILFCPMVLRMSVNLSKPLAASLEFCWSRVMYKIFNVSDSVCAETILFYMGILPISYQIDLCKLRFYYDKFMYCNHVCGDDIVWLLAHATKRRFTDELFWSNRVHGTGSMLSYYRAVWKPMRLLTILHDFAV
jgi:hypothetical protein